MIKIENIEVFNFEGAFLKKVNSKKGSLKTTQCIMEKFFCKR